MAQYLAFLRGVNVGGNNMVKMSVLKTALEDDGFTDVKTYIQSGNVFVSTPQRSRIKVADAVAATIKRHFKLDVKVVVFTKAEWQAVVDSAPKWWGGDADWRHDIYILLPPLKAKACMDEIGELKPDIEMTHAGVGVVYASLLLEKYGRTTLGRTASKPFYKQITIRNYNTATKLLKLFA